VTAPRTQPPRSDAPWDVSYLRVGALAAGVAALVAAPVALAVGGWDAALGVLVAAVVVTAFFVVSGLVVAWAGRIDDSFTLPAALGMFFVKAMVLYLVLFSLPEHGALDRLTLAWGVIVGALLWSAVQLRWVWTRQLYYVSPPAPPGTGAAQEGPAEHPNSPPTRG
jgi:hypothetical protein